MVSMDMSETDSLNGDAAPVIKPITPIGMEHAALKSQDFQVSNENLSHGFGEFISWVKSRLGMMRRGNQTNNSYRNGTCCIQISRLPGE